MSKLLLLVLLAAPAFATLPAKLQFNVRTADGADTNGGGFVAAGTGTDYSRQAAAQFLGTDLASTVGTTNPCVVTSATHNFVATDVDNLIQVTAGINWTAGFYRIVSAAANAATLDRACGSAATLTGGTWAVGGALATIAQAETAVVAGNTVNIMAGTTTLTSTLTLTASGGGAAGPITWEGYGVTPGDLGTKPLITSSTNSVALITFSSGPQLRVFRNLSLSSTAGTRGAGFVTNGAQAAYVWGDRLLMDGFERGFSFDNGPAWGVYAFTLSNSEIKNCNYGATVSFGIESFFNYWHNNTTADVYPVTKQAGMTFSFYWNTFYHSGVAFYSHEIPNQNQYILIGNNFSDETVGVQFASSNSNLPWMTELNNSFYGNTTDVDNPNTTPNNLAGVFSRANGYSGTSNHWLSPEIILSADPWTARASNNFVLNNAAGGGALLHGTGNQGINLFGAGYPDVGALETQANSGGGGNSAVIQ